MTDTLITHLHIEPTTKCNSLCRHCIGRYSRQGDIDISTFEKSLELSPAIESLALHGEGEPLIHKDFFILAEIGREHNIRLHTTTNGSQLDQQIIENFIDLKFSKILISIESANKEIYRKYRSGNLDKIISGLELFLKLKQKHRASLPHIGFSVTVMKDTVGELPGIIDLYESLCLDGGINFLSLKQLPAYIEKYPEEIKGQVINSSEWKKLQLQIYASRKFKDISPADPEHPGFFRELMHLSRHGSRSCAFLQRGLFVNHEGYAMGCCLHKDVRFSFGNINTETRDQILYKRGLLIAQLKKGVIPEPCKGCGIAETATASHPRNILELYLNLSLYRIFKKDILTVK